MTFLLFLISIVVIGRLLSHPKSASVPPPEPAPRSKAASSSSN
jgi:hypothetical protein